MAIPLTTMTGRLTADPELRYTASGTPVANFRMAENDNKYNEDTREWETTNTLFLTVNAWERLAERFAILLILSFCSRHASIFEDNADICAVISLSSFSSAVFKISAAQTAKR